MSYSRAKFRSSGGGGNLNLVGFAIINRTGASFDIDSLQLINGVDDPMINLEPGTGYNNTYPIDGTGTPSYGKALLDLTNPPTAIRIQYTGTLPGIPWIVVATTFGDTVQEAQDLQSDNGTYFFNVPCDFAPGKPATIIFSQS
jgi:hypothetical protein